MNLFQVNPNVIAEIVQLYLYNYEYLESLPKEIRKDIIDSEIKRKHSTPDVFQNRHS